MPEDLGGDASATTNNSLSTAENHPFNLALSGFLTETHSIITTIRIVFPHVVTWLRDEHKKNAETLSRYEVDSKNVDEWIQPKTAHDEAELMNALRNAEKLAESRIAETVQKSLFIQIFSAFDAFTGALLKAIYSRKSDLLKGVSKELSFADLLSYESLDAVKADMLEKEIDSFRRESYVDQFAKLESKFGLKTLRSFPEWPEFIELSQRRNLLVHNAGRVNDQYLAVCDREGYKFSERPAIGAQLLPDAKYFVRAIVLVSKVGFMLTHTLWRKLCPEETELAHEALNDTIFEVLRDKRWNTAREMSEFALSEPITKKISDVDLRVRTINAAIAAKFSEYPKRAESLLASIDWTASNRDFKLAIAVLEDRFDDAAQLMKLIGSNGEIVEELTYHQWPLFFKFRETKQFLNAYVEVYGTSFIRDAVRHSADEVKKRDEALQFANSVLADSAAGEVKSEEPTQPDPL